MKVIPLLMVLSAIKPTCATFFPFENSLFHQGIKNFLGIVVPDPRQVYFYDALASGRLTQEQVAEYLHFSSHPTVLSVHMGGFKVQK